MTIKNPRPAVPVGSGAKGTTQASAKSASRKPRAQKISTDPASVPGPWVIPDDTRRALEKCELFRDFTRAQLMQVAALVEERTLEPDEVLLVEGEPAQHLMIIVEGQGVAQLNLDQGLISLGLVGPSEVAGWSSLLEGQVYPASVTALTPMRVATFEASGLTLLMNLDPAIGYPIHRRLSGIFFLQYQSALQAIKTAM
ncbi:MAG: cyclic nucleotide-binding domain-containing protein [SAR202 cluster bacterium]|nr:cyclic nucleotide-binding domain-containing protein [SAR202 cluster bacterium]